MDLDSFDVGAGVAMCTGGLPAPTLPQEQQHPVTYYGQCEGSLELMQSGGGQFTTMSPPPSVHSAGGEDAGTPPDLCSAALLQHDSDYSFPYQQEQHAWFPSATTSAPGVGASVGEHLGQVESSYWPESGCAVLPLQSTGLPSSYQDSRQEINTLPGLGALGVCASGRHEEPPPHQYSESSGGDAPAGPGKHSYIALISMAIQSSPSQRLLLTDIYQWIERRYPGVFSPRDKGWRNSIRHNLSINDCFVKCGRSENRNKGNYWTVHPDSRAEFWRGDYHRRKVRKRNKKCAGGASGWPYGDASGGGEVQQDKVDGPRRELPDSCDEAPTAAAAATVPRSPFVPMTQTFVTDPVLERTFGADLLSLTYI